MTVTKELNGSIAQLVHNRDKPTTLSTGIKVRINPAPAMTVEQAVGRIKFPDVPKQVLEDGREVENPNHPQYLKEVKEAIMKQSLASIDVMIAFVDLVDGVPEGNDWLKSLRFLERLGHLDLSSYDLDDELDREFVYKKFIAISSDDLQIIGQAGGISKEDADIAKATFQGVAA